MKQEDPEGKFSIELVKVPFSDDGSNAVSPDDKQADVPLSDQKGTREYRYKFYTFLVIAFLQIFINYDNGVVPVILNWIQGPFDFKTTQLGIMGSLPYLGYLVLSPILSHILINYSSKIALVISFVLNVASLAVFALAVNKWMFFVSKFFIGATQALFFTYYPLWIDIFAPEHHRNLWMSIVQGGIVVGMMIGYILTSLFGFMGERGWRYSLLLQIICESILVVLFYLLPDEFINYDHTKEEKVNFDLCMCDKTDPDEKTIKLPVISEQEDLVFEESRFPSKDSRASIESHNLATSTNNPLASTKQHIYNKNSEVSFGDSNKIEMEVESKDSNISDTILYFKQLAASNVEYNLKRCQSLDITVGKVSSLGLGSNKEIAKIYSNFEQSMINPPQYSKCSKCFLNNIKLYNERMHVKNLPMFTKFKLLINQSVYVLTCIAISSLYFEVFGINFWMTNIGVTHLKVKERAVHLIFAVEMIAGPVLGIVSGSYLIDQLIYHYPQYPLLVDLTLIVWGVCACVAGVVLVIVQTPMIFAVCIFIILFYGAALVPTLTLTSVAYLPHSLKPAGASFFMCQYQILGFMMGTLVPGVVVDVFHNFSAGLYIIYLSGFVGLGSLVLTLYIKWRRINKAKLSGRNCQINLVVT